MPVNQIQYSEKYYDDVRTRDLSDATKRMRCDQCVLLLRYGYRTRVV